MSVKWADLTIRLAMRANRMIVKWTDHIIRLTMKANIMIVKWTDDTICLVMCEELFTQQHDGVTPIKYTVSLGVRY